VSTSPYSIPYRILYSKNVENLFFAGRNVSMTHTAMSSVRVMATCALLGEAVGKAVSVAVKNNLTPHGVYLSNIQDVQTLLLNEGCFLPSITRKVGKTCLLADLSPKENSLRNGQDRGHRLYGTTQENCCVYMDVSDRATQIISYCFPLKLVKEIHLEFCSDLNRKSLDMGLCERSHATRSNQRLDSPQVHMPTSMCKKFELYGFDKNGEELILSVDNNRKRTYHLKVDKVYEKLSLYIQESWGGVNLLSIISFDFN